MTVTTESNPAISQFILQNYDIENIPVYVDTTTPFLLILVEGEIKVAYDSFQPLVMKPGDSIMVMRHACCRIYPNRASTGMYINLSGKLTNSLHDFFGNPSEILPKNHDFKLHPLPGVPAILKFVDSICTFLCDRQSTPELDSLWIDLLVSLIAQYHAPQIIAEFIYPVMSGDYDFRHIVIENSLKVKGLPELASACSMSLSTFKRRFKRTFHSPAHTWIAARKAHYIYSEIVRTRKTFVEIAEQFNISSSAYLTAFCKQHFGLTPQEIRRRGHHSFSTIDTAAFNR